MIIFLTGRFESYEALTKKWLSTFIPLEDYLLFQRKRNDFRPAKIVKKESLSKITAKYEIKAFIEDDDEIISIGKKMGLNCIDAK